MSGGDEILSGTLEDLMAAAAGSLEALERTRSAGRRTLDAWIADGTMIDHATTCLRGAEGRGADELVTISSGGEQFYLACVLDLPPTAVAFVNAGLGTAGPASRLLWWKRPHGALAALTIADAIRAGRLQRCVEIAEAYAEENGYGPTTPPDDSP